ncbi:50S ribosomal protein L20-like [Paramacrobiotus metropolitanus]|uniref:50S ribosomal protein L20-like n=1 Tax=Paramacrobiotus metropolitanus TaxID=2943436 RepID=UPI002445C5D0|nr:50S ribosomal protein L20-like [Paramacrobiotus metropolitanus]
MKLSSILSAVRNQFLWTPKHPAPEQFFRKKPHFRLAAYMKGRRRNCWTLMRTQLEKQLLLAAWGRHMTSREKRYLRITRMEGALTPFGLPYEQYMENLAKMNILLNRKILADFGIWEPRTFRSLTTLVGHKCDLENITTPVQKAVRPYPTDSVLVRRCLEF